MVKKLKKKLAKIKLFQVKITSLFFSIIGLLAITYISYFLYFQISAPREIDDLLPAENLILFTDFSKKNFPKTLVNNVYFQNEVLAKNLKQYLNQTIEQFELQSNEWLGDRVGLAIYQSIQKLNQYNYFLLLENTNQHKALDFLRSMGTQEEKLITEDYKRFKIISFSQTLNLNCSFMYGYFICSDSKDALKKIIETSKSEVALLSSFTPYNKVKNNLPKTSSGKAYFNFKNFDYHFLNLYLSPIKDYLNEGGVTFETLDNGLRLNSYLSLEKGLVQTGAVINNVDLTPYVYADSLGIYLGGANLTYSFEKILQTWDEITPYFSIIIEGMLRAKINTYFGEQVSLEEDLYPLFKNNYAFELNLDSQSFLPQFKLILDVENVTQIEPILQKMLDGFYSRSGLYMPQEEKTTLPDGSIVTELVADETKVQKKSEDFDGIQIDYVSIEGVPFGFAYAIYQNKVFLASDYLALKDNLSLIKHPENSLAKNQDYQTFKNKVFLKGEESSYLNLQRIKLFLKALDFATPEMEMLFVYDYAFFSTKWFDDGMANEMVFLKTEK